MDLKYCLYCEKLLEKRVNERPDAFKARVYCNSKCSRIGSRAKMPLKFCVYCGLKLARKRYGAMVSL